MKWIRRVTTGRWCCGVLGLGVMLAGIGCSVEEKSPRGTSGNGTSRPGQSGESLELSGRVLIDGSSTVFPISQAVAEEFQKQQTGVKVTVGTRGTGGGFERFCRGETDINDASRPIAQDEVDLCEQNGIEYVELKVAIDGLSVMVNPENTWCEVLTVGQLRELWKPGSEIKTWNQLNSGWPNEEIALFGPDTDSGTFDYFTEEVVGESGASRSDYQASTDDNVLVRGISGETYALGYFGYAYYVENQGKLKLVAISPTDDPADAVKPTPETIENGTYRPLSRPLFLYVNKEKLKKPQVAAFLRYYLHEGQDLVGEVGYVQLSQKQVEASRQALEEAIAEVAN